MLKGLVVNSHTQRSTQAAAFLVVHPPVVHARTIISATPFQNLSRFSRFRVPLNRDSSVRNMFLLTFLFYWIVALCITTLRPEINFLLISFLISLILTSLYVVLSFFSIFPIFVHIVDAIFYATPIYLNLFVLHMERESPNRIIVTDFYNLV